MTVEAIEDTEDTDKEETTSAELFIIDNREKADWFLRKLANLEAEKARIKMQAKKMLAQIDGEISALSFRHYADLEQFTRIELDRIKSKRKSILLFHGTLGFRNQPLRASVEDDQAAFDWAFKNGRIDLLRIDGSAYIRAGLSRLKNNGEVLPGLHPEGAQENVFYFRVPKPILLTDDDEPDGEEAEHESSL